MTGFPPEVRGITTMRAQHAWTGHILMVPRCEVMHRCKGADATQRHHRRPRGSGGSRREDTNTASNCLMTCLEDHSYIEAHREEAMRNGWLISNFNKTPPTQVPCLYRGRWVLLTDAGEVLSL